MCPPSLPGASFGRGVGRLFPGAGADGGDAAYLPHPPARRAAAGLVPSHPRHRQHGHTGGPLLLLEMGRFPDFKISKLEWILFTLYRRLVPKYSGELNGQQDNRAFSLQVQRDRL